MSTQSLARPVTKGGSPTVFVSDLDRSVAFYTESLGLALQFRAGPHFAMIDAGSGLTIGLHPPDENTPPPGAAGGIQIGLTVEIPIDQAVTMLRSRGVRFTSPVIDDGPVKLAFFTDPDGNVLYLFEYPQ